MMNKEILMVVDAVSNEKGVDKEVIFEALEAALASATRKKHGEEWDARVSIDRKSGDYETFRRWKVFADDSKELEVPERELRLEDARDIDRDVEIGGYVEEPMESVAFGRIAAQQAKQVIVQKVREAERAQVVDAYRDRVGTLVSGVVKRVDRNGIYVDLGSNAEGFIPRTDMIPREQVKPQDRIKAFLKEVRSEPRGPQLFLTRTAPEFLMELFKLEVPGSRPGSDPDPRRGPRCGRAREDRGAQQRSARRSRRRLRRYARLARAGGLERDRRRARGHHSLRREPGAVRDQRHGARRSHVHRGGRGFALAWTSRCRRTSCRRPSAAAARTSVWRASSPAGI